MVPIDKDKSNETINKEPCDIRCLTREKVLLLRVAGTFKICLPVVHEVASTQHKFNPLLVRHSPILICVNQLAENEQVDDLAQIVRMMVGKEFNDGGGEQPNSGIVVLSIQFMYVAVI